MSHVANLFGQLLCQVPTKNNIPVHLYLSNNGKCAIVCLSSQNGKLRKTSLVDLKDLLTVNIDMFDSVKDWLDKFIRKAS